MVSLNLDAVFEFDTPARLMMSWYLCILELPHDLTPTNKRNLIFLCYNSTKQTNNPPDNWSLGAPTTTLLQAKAANWKADRNQWDCEFAALRVSCNIDFCWHFMFAMLHVGCFRSLRYGRSAHRRRPTPALPLLPHWPEPRALLRCPRTPHSVLRTPRLLVRFHDREPLFSSSFLTAMQFSDLASHSSLLPSLTPLVTAAGHTVTPSLSSPEPELLTLSPFFLLSESAFPDFSFPEHSLVWLPQQL